MLASDSASSARRSNFIAAKRTARSPLQICRTYRAQHRRPRFPAEDRVRTERALALCLDHVDAAAGLEPPAPSVGRHPAVRRSSATTCRQRWPTDATWSTWRRRSITTAWTRSPTSTGRSKMRSRHSGRPRTPCDCQTTSRFPTTSSSASSPNSSTTGDPGGGRVSGPSFRVSCDLPDRRHPAGGQADAHDRQAGQHHRTGSCEAYNGVPIRRGDVRSRRWRRWGGRRRGESGRRDHV